MNINTKSRSIQIISNREGVTINLYRGTNDGLNHHVMSIHAERLSRHTRFLVDKTVMAAPHFSVALFANFIITQVTFLRKPAEL